MLSIVIPAYNEEKLILDTLNEIKSVLKDNKLLKETEIIVVNDGSTDNTQKIAESCGVTVINNVCNMGYGYSLKKGISIAKNNTIIITDADKTYPFSAIIEMLELKNKGFDLVVGVRTKKVYKERFIKKILRFQLKVFVQFISGKKIKDINSGLRIFDKNTVTKYFPRLCNTFSFTTSQTLAYLMNSLTVGYVDFNSNDKQQNKKDDSEKDKNNVCLACQRMNELLDDYLDSKTNKSVKYIIESGIYYNPLKIFSLLTFICILLSIVGFLFSHYLDIKAGYILGIGGLLVSIIVFSLGLMAELLKQIMDK